MPRGSCRSSYALRRGGVDFGLKPKGALSGEECRGLDRPGASRYLHRSSPTIVMTRRSTAQVGLDTQTCASGRPPSPNSAMANVVIPVREPCQPNCGQKVRSALPNTCRSPSILKGLDNCCASEMPEAVLALSSPLAKTIRTLGQRSLTCLASSIPDMPGSPTSVSNMSILLVSRTLRASSAELASCTV